MTTAKTPSARSRAVAKIDDAADHETAPARNREKQVSDLIKEINKKHGDGSALHGLPKTAAKIEVIPTGSIALDAALGVGGIPRGRCTEIYGGESAGKSTLAMHIMANAQNMGLHAGYIDVEHALDESYARNLGLDLDRLVISQPGSAETALDICFRLIRVCSVVVIDSVAALVPQAEVDGEIGDPTVALQARLMSQTLRKLNPEINAAKSAVVFINQIREKIGGYGNPEDTPGGRALKFYCCTRIGLRRSGYINQAGTRVMSRADTKGNVIQATVTKNKVGPPFRRAEFEIIYGKGILREAEIVEFAAKYGLLTKRGNHHYYQDEPIGNGKDNAKNYLLTHPEISDILYGQINEIMADPQRARALEAELADDKRAAANPEADEPASDD